MGLSKNKVKFIRSLSKKKFRQKYGKFLAEGDKIVGELIRQKPGFVDAVYGTGNWLKTAMPFLQSNEITWEEIGPEALKRVSGLTTPNDVLAVVDMPDFQVHSSNLRSGLSLFLEDIRDPGNLGTILRIADWFGLPHVFCSPGCVDGFNPKVVQASMGAFLRVSFPTATLADIKDLE
ncbi:MAG: TrmH family RNA methyltransferase, partial [Saprospiraceae bacterium]|nr:TrmH family RNA methyltransferase [Saprospiraceae bacterium]